MAMCVSQLLAILKPVAASNSSLQTDEAIKDALIQELTGTEACASAFAAPSADETVVISTLRFPAWFNGAVTTWLKDQLQSNPQVVALLQDAIIDVPDTLPALGSFSAGSMRDYLTVQQNQYSVVSMDVSGFPAWSVWAMLQTADPFVIPENVCVNDTEPRGLIHPRVYLTMFYRAEALAALEAGGYVPSAAPPDDWEQLIALLEGHRLANSSRSSSSSSSSNSSSSSSSGGGGSNRSSLPKYGLCISTHPACGLLGDFWAALAASVLQTQGTEQGYLYDLSTGSPSSAIPLANSTGWLYATELLRRVMVFNAPEPFDLTTNNRTTDGEVECTDVSGHFKSGDCMITFDWDIMLGVMNTTQLRPPAAQLLVAPLPGSRTVMDRRAGSSTSGQLVPCDWELCGVSANHDLLYLGLQQAPPPSSAVAAASAQPELARTRAAVAAAAQALEPQAPVSVLTASTGSLPTHCDPSVTAAVESAAVQQVLSAAGVQQPAAGALVNRAPYSACMMSANKYQSTDAGLTLSSRTFATVGAIITSLMDAQYVRRNVATVMARAALGYPVATTGVMLTTTAYGSMSTSNSSSSGVSSGASNSASSNSNDTLTAANGTAASGNSVAAAGSAAADTGMLLYLRMRWWTALREPFNVSGFEGTGISDDAIQSCAQAVWHGLHAPNAAPEAASPAPVNFIKWGLASAANMLILPINTSTAAANASAALQEVMYMVNEAFTERATRTMYESSIDYQAQSKAPSKQGAAGPGSKAISNEALAGLLVGLIAAVILGIVVVVVVALRLRRRNRDLLGRVRAPRVGVDTTLLISDIQNSTRLWEELSVTTMDAALKMHHATFCKLIPAHDGYESATEGDSFIIAFPSPASALAFATACQLALLHQDWPQELLQHPDGAVVAVEARGGREGTGGFRHSCRSPAKSMRNLRGDSPPQSWQPLSAAISLWDRLSGRAKQRQAVGPSRGLAAGDSELRFSGAALHTGTSAGGLVVSPEPHLAQLHLDSGGTDACGRALTDEGPSSCGVRSPDAGGETGENHVPQLTTGAQLTAGSPQHIQPQLPPVLSKLSEGGSGAAGSEQEQQDGSINSALHHEPGDHAGQVQATPVGSDVEPFSTTSYSTLAAVSGITAATASIGTTWGRVLAMMYPLESVTSSAGTGSSGPATGGLGGAVTPLRRLIQTAYSHSGALGHGNSAKITCFRGPRVRMGMHCGLDDGRHVVWNRVNSTFQYTGPFAETAKLVSDAAHGGLVTLSAAAFARYRNCTSAASGAAEHVPRKAHGIVIAYAGHHILSDKPPTALPASLKGGEVAASSNVFVEHVMLELHDGGDGACVAATQAAEAISGQVALFLAVPASLLCRLAYTPPLRTLRQVQLGSLAAPTGSVTIAFMKVVGASTLLTELPGPASRALDQFQRLACGLLMGAEETTEQGAALDFRGRSGGYLVEGGDGLVLAAFGSPLAAVEWALDTVEALRELVWEEELLAHELCEEVLTVSPGAVTNAATMYAAASTLAPHAASFHSTRGGRAPSPSPLGPADPRLGALAPAFTPAPVSASPPQLSWLHQSHLNPQLAGTDALALFRAGSTRVVAAAERRTTERGLRVKVGLDVGPVTYSLTESSGRLSYRGRVMNRAARIAGTASPGQVLCSGAVWAACEAGMAAVPLPGSSQQLVGVSLGKVALKGITSPVEIFQCQHEGC